MRRCGGGSDARFDQRQVQLLVTENRGELRRTAGELREKCGEMRRNAENWTREPMNRQRTNARFAFRQQQLRLGRTAGDQREWASTTRRSDVNGRRLMERKKGKNIVPFVTPQTSASATSSSPPQPSPILPRSPRSPRSPQFSVKSSWSCLSRSAHQSPKMHRRTPAVVPLLSRCCPAVVPLLSRCCPAVVPLLSHQAATLATNPTGTSHTRADLPQRRVRAEPTASMAATQGRI